MRWLVCQFRSTECPLGKTHDFLSSTSSHLSQEKDMRSRTDFRRDIRCAMLVWTSPAIVLFLPKSIRVRTNEVLTQYRSHLVASSPIACRRSQRSIYSASIGYSCATTWLYFDQAGAQNGPMSDLSSRGKWSSRRTVSVASSQRHGIDDQQSSRRTNIGRV